MATALQRPDASRRGQPLERWEPFRQLEQLQDATAQLLENVWSGTGATDRAWSPLVDIEEADDAWIVEAELPGIDRKDVSVELRDSELSITGEPKERAQGHPAPSHAPGRSVRLSRQPARRAGPRRRRRHARRRGPHRPRSEGRAGPAATDCRPR
jgi:hypothetical protein